MGYVLSLALPLVFLAFLLSGPHPGFTALWWMLPLIGLIGLDSLRLDPLHEGPLREGSEGLGQAVLAIIVVLVPLLLPVMGLFVRDCLRDPDLDAWSLALNLLVLRFLGGTVFCCALIAPAHELMHRRSRFQRRLARGLLWLVFADPFYLTHGAAHHRYLGQAEDPSTARSDEGYDAFFWRSFRRQWSLARHWFPASFGLGLAMEGLLLVIYTSLFGVVAAVIWLYLAWVAQRLLEAVNYFQHFGLGHEGSAAGAIAWHSQSAVSHYLFFGLTRHADHHLRPTVPFFNLRSVKGTPCLPFGYLGMALWVKNHSSSFRRWALGVLDDHSGPLNPVPDSSE